MADATTGHVTKTKHYQSPRTERPKVQFAPPRNVSPFIKFSRYSLLIAGIMYGSWRFKDLQKKEAAIQEREKPIRHLLEKRKQERIALEKQQQMISLAKEAGVTPK